MSTTLLKKETLERKWYVIDAAGKPLVENQSQTKRVESCLVRCLDGGSSPPISTQVESSKGDSIFFDNKAVNLHGFS